MARTAASDRLAGDHFGRSTEERCQTRDQILISMIDSSSLVEEALIEDVTVDVEGTPAREVDAKQRLMIGGSGND